MKLIQGNDRTKSAVQFYRNNGFSYQLEPDFAKVPDYLAAAGFPTGCCDEEGNIYAVCRNNEHPIVLLDSEGNYLRDFGKGLFKTIHDIKITPWGTLLCVDDALHGARELSMDGELIRDIGNLGQPSDTGYDPDIWKKLRAEGRLATYDLYYNAGVDFLEKVRTIRRTAAPFNKPTGIAFNSKGEMFFSDGYGNAAVHKFNKDGELLKTWGAPGEGPGKFLVVHDVWVDTQDRVWVADREGSAVHIFSGDGELLGYAGGCFYQPSGLWGDDKYVYAGERGGGLSIFDMELNIAAQLGFPFSSLRFHGLCGNGQGVLYGFSLHSFPGYPIFRLTRCEK